MIQNLDFVKELAHQKQAALEAGDLHEFARLMDIPLAAQEKRSANMSNQHINECYDHAIADGALAVS